MVEKSLKGVLLKHQKEKKQQPRRYISWILLLASIGISTTQLACGGAVSETPSCQDVYQELIAKSEDETCSPVLYNHFESQVTEWRGQCTDKNMALQRKEMAQRLKSAQQCSEKRRQAERLEATCQSRLDKLTQAQTCIGEECAPAKAELEKIVATCSNPMLGGKYTERIEMARGMLDERIQQADRLKSLQRLMMTCDEVYEFETPKQARARLTEIIAEIASTEELDEIPEKGSEVERFQVGALESCDYALTGTLKKLTEIPPKDLDRINHTKRVQKRYVRKYRRIVRRLEKIDAPSRFPNAMSSMKEAFNMMGAETSALPSKASGKKRTKSSKKRPAVSAAEQMAFIKTESDDTASPSQESGQKETVLVSAEIDRNR